jgi:hypothetical protein
VKNRSPIPPTTLSDDGTRQMHDGPTDDLPFDPPGLHRGGHRIRDTYHAFGGGGRGLRAALGYVAASINGTMRVNDAGNHWLSLRVPTHQHPLRRNLATIIVITIAVGAIVVLATTIHESDPAVGVPILVALALFIVAAGAPLIAYGWRTWRNDDRPPPKPRHCVTISSLAKPPGDHDEPTDGLRMAGELGRWLDRHDLHARVFAVTPRIGRAYRWTLGMTRVGHASVPYQRTLVEVLDRVPNQSRGSTDDDSAV